MLKENRVILMTRMASFEKGEGKRSMKVRGYFRSDFIAIQLLKAIVCITLAFLLGLAIYIFYDFESFMQRLYSIDEILTFAQTVLKYYVIAAAAYCVLAYIVANYKFYVASKNLKKYQHNLKKLNSVYTGTPVKGKKAGGRK